MLSRVLSIGQKHYPENLQKGLFINAPLIFSAAFQVVSSVLSEHTVSKIQITYDHLAWTRGEARARCCPRTAAIMKMRR